MGRLRWAALVGGIVVLALLSVDLTRPPHEQQTARVVLGAIHLYRGTVGPYLGTTCRFTPTCSHYATGAIETRGLVAGGWLAAQRLARCGPWTPRGTVDPPPAATATPGARY